MNRRLSLAAIAATTGAGMLSAAFLQSTVASADAGTDAGFTIGSLTFEDPVAIDNLTGTQTAGYESLTPLFANSPLLSIGTDDGLGILKTGSQQFTLEDSSGTTLGTVVTQVNDQDLLGIDTAQLTVASTDAASGLTASQAAELPADGTVYSITNLGGGFANVYEAIPNADDTAASSINDTLVTPFGNVNIPTTWDAIAPLNPATPLEALGNTSGVTGLSDNAFTIDGTTFDPGADGISVSQPLELSSFAPLLNFTASDLNLSGTGSIGTQTAQDFAVYTNGTDAGSISSYLWYSDILGIDSTQFTVGAVDPGTSTIESALSNLDFTGADFTAQDLANALAANSPVFDYGTGDITSADVNIALISGGINLTGSDITDADIASVLNDISVADLPAAGTVYSVTDLGGGYENVYEAIPAAGSSGSSTITDTLVTPFGDINLPTSFDATAPLDPAAPLGALAATSSSADLSANAFTIDGTTFDPGADGFSTADTYPLFGIAPLLEIGGVNLLGDFLPTQDGVAVYDSSGTDLGTVDLGENMSNILGIDTTQFTVSSVDAASGLTAAQTAELPAEGTVYSVTDLGSFTNVYEAIPDADGTAASSITDTLITPFGDINLSTMFDAIAGLSPGDAVAGVDAADIGSAASAAIADIFDPGSWF